MTAAKEECWLPIPGYEGRYDVSDMGRVRSWLRMGKPLPRILIPTPGDWGYPRVGLFLDGQRIVRKVHQLVALAFLGPRPEGQEVLHVDGNPANPQLANLRYGTSRENKLDVVRHGKHNHASKTHCIHGHPFDAANTYSLRGRRLCRTCRAGRNRQRYLARVSAESGSQIARKAWLR